MKPLLVYKIILKLNVLKTYFFLFYCRRAREAIEVLEEELSDDVLESIYSVIPSYYPYLDE